MKTAAEVMNRSFLYACPLSSIGPLLNEMGERGLGSVPVLDLAGRPLGVATLAEVERCYDVEELTERLRRPALCMDENTPVDVAARTLARHPSSCLILVNAHGVAAGVLSPLDLLRAVLGLNGAADLMQAHEGDVSWDDAELLELGAVHQVPEAPGILLLSPGFDERKQRIVWAESATNMRERLDQMLRQPDDDPRLESILEAYPRTVRFRCLTIYDTAQRQQLAHELCNVAPRAPRTPEPKPTSRISGVMPKVMVGAALRS